MKVMTYNILNDHPKFATHSKKNWQNRKQYLFEHIQIHQPDLLAIQEGKTNQIEELKAVFPGFFHYGVASGGKYGGEQAAIFYHSNKFTLLDKATFWLSDTPGQVSKHKDASHHRICSYVQLKEKETAQTFFHFNTHLDAKSKTAQLEGIRLILQKIEALKSRFPDAHFILSGDFNAHTKSLPYLELSNHPLLEDTFHKAQNRVNNLRYTFSGMDKGWTLTKLFLHIFYPNYMHKRLDHIFVSPEIEVVSYEISNWSYRNAYPSDHLPVIVELQLSIH